MNKNIGLNLKMFSLLLIALAFLSVGCDRYIESMDPVRSLPDASIVAEDMQVAVNDRSATLSWVVSDSSLVKSFRIYVFDSTFVSDSSSLEPVKLIETSDYNYEVTGLLVNRLYFFQVAVVFSTGLEGNRTATVSARISNLSIIIDNGNEFTNDRNVTINVNTSSKATDIVFSEDSSFSDAVYESFAITKSFNLTDADGIRKVYARLQFADGSQTGKLLSDEITLDREIEIDSVLFTKSDTIVTGDTIYFQLYAQEVNGQASVSFGSQNNLELFDDGTHGDLAANDMVYSAIYVVPVNLSLNNVIVAGSFTDEAGNSTNKNSSDVLNVFSVPLPVTASAVVLSSFEISLNWTTSTSNDFLSYRIYRSNISGVSESSDLIKTITGKNTKTYTDTTLSDNSTYYYKVYVVGASGFSSGSSEIAATTDTNFAPDSTILSLSLQSDSTVQLNWSRNNENDFNYYTVLRGVSVDSSATPDTLTGASTLTIINLRSTTKYDSYLPDTVMYFFQVFTYDRHGLSTGSNVVSAQRQ